MGAPSDGKGKPSAKGPPPPRPPSGKGAGATGAPQSWRSAPTQVNLPDNNRDILAQFKQMPSYSAEELQQIDWSKMDDLAVIKGSLEIDEALTGIVVASVSGQLVGIRNICTGRQPVPVREYFAVVLNRLLGPRGVALAEWRILHRGSPSMEYRLAQAGLRGCIQAKTGLQGLLDEANDSDPNAWVAQNPGFCDMQHDLVRVLGVFLAARERQPSFTAVMEVVPGLQVLLDQVTLRQELSINAALGLTPDQAGYVRREHANPLHSAQEPEARGRMLEEMGKLTAFDAILNNWDRVGLKLMWDNKGNLTNLCVERDSLRIVGVDQAVQPIDRNSSGLDTYRKRLRALVEYALRMEGSNFRDPQLAELDARSEADEVIAAFIAEETAREQREQARILGHGPQNDGLTGKGAELKDYSPVEAVQDLAKELYNGTGVLFELAFVGKHFVGGLVAGLRGIREAARGTDELLQEVAEEVRAAFANTEDKTVDLEGNVGRCVDFVQGNLEVVRECFLNKKFPLSSG